jgi:head-tail adaptor
VLTDSELASMRETYGDSLPGTAIIQNPARTSNGGGGFTTSWAAGGTVDCRVAPAGGQEEVAGHRVQPDTEVIFSLPQSTVISPQSRILYESRVYSVTSVRAPRTWEVSRRVEAKEVV